MLLKTKTFTGGRCGFRRGANRPSYQFLFNVWRQQCMHVIALVLRCQRLLSVVQVFLKRLKCTTAFTARER